MLQQGGKFGSECLLQVAMRKKKTTEETEHKIVSGQAAGLLLTLPAKLLIYSNINILYNQAKFTV